MEQNNRNLYHILSPAINHRRLVRAHDTMVISTIPMLPFSHLNLRRNPFGELIVLCQHPNQSTIMSPAEHELVAPHMVQMLRTETKNVRSSLRRFGCFPDTFRPS